MFIHQLIYVNPPAPRGQVDEIQTNIGWVGDSQEFENIRFFGLDLTSWISKFSIFFFGKLFFALSKK